MNGFIDAINKDVDQFTRDFGETWVFDGVTYQAVNISDLTGQVLASAGGRYSDASVNVTITNEVRVQSNVKEGSRIEVRGKRVRVNGTNTNMDSTTTLICGPVSAKL